MTTVQRLTTRYLVVTAVLAPVADVLSHCFSTRRTFVAVMVARSGARIRQDPVLHENKVVGILSCSSPTNDRAL